MGRKTKSEAEVPSEIRLNVLGYHEEGKWVALALEMDIRGRGPTFKAALDDLLELVEMQISFAKFKDQPELLWEPAEDIYWQRFQEARKRRILESFWKDVSTSDSEDEAGTIPLPHIIASRPDFSQANA